MKRERRRDPREPYVMSFSPRATMKRVRFGGGLTVECPRCCDQRYVDPSESRRRDKSSWTIARAWLRSHAAVCLASTRGGVPCAR